MVSMRVLKKILIAASLLTAAGSAIAADVGVSISVGQPGFYGRIDIGDYPYPQPRLIYRQPVLVHRHVDVYEPIYMRVPPGHAKRWSQYCGRYNACDYPVYFVQDSWYHNDFAPHYRAYHQDYYRDHDDGRGGRDYDNHDNRGRGKGRGRH